MEHFKLQYYSQAVPPQHPVSPCSLRAKATQMQDLAPPKRKEWYAQICVAASSHKGHCWKLIVPACTAKPAAPLRKQSSSQKQAFLTLWPVHGLQILVHFHSWPTAHRCLELLCRTSYVSVQPRSIIVECIYTKCLTSCRPSQQFWKSESSAVRQVL